MNVERGQGAGGHGLVLVPGPARAVHRWLRRGLVAVRVADLGAWTGICLAEDRARSAAPYDVGLEVLAAAPAPLSRRPALGFFVIRERAVVTVQVRAWRSAQVWLVWEPGVGVRTPESLRPMPPTVLIRASGAAQRVSLERLTAHVALTDGSPIAWLSSLLTLLDLPGVDLLEHGGTADLEEIAPSVRSVRAFDAMVAEDAAYRAELGTREARDEQ